MKNYNGTAETIITVGHGHIIKNLIKYIEKNLGNQVELMDSGIYENNNFAISVYFDISNKQILIDGSKTIKLLFKGISPPSKETDYNGCSICDQFTQSKCASYDTTDLYKKIYNRIIDNIAGVEKIKAKQIFMMGLSIKIIILIALLLVILYIFYVKFDFMTTKSSLSNLSSLYAN